VNIIWELQDNDIIRLKVFMQKNTNPFVARRILRNVNHVNLQLDKNSMLKTFAMCLLTTQQRSGPNSPISIFLRKEPFPLTIENIENVSDTEKFVRDVMQQNGLNRYKNRIPNYFSSNFQQLQTTNWQLLETLKTLNGDRRHEREIADNISDTFLGFGPKQSRNYLQALGLVKYEIPIDSRITSWLNNFGFPVSLSSIALQDKGYYHFVSDGIQHLCDEAEIYPCVLDAAIFSSFDNGLWTEENSIF
jgi:hypothetical protein